MNAPDWHFACELDEILPYSGVNALIEGRQIAIFRVADTVHALDNHDPHSAVNVLSRGLVGDARGEWVVASPIYKQHFSLLTGRCLEDADRSVSVYPAARRRRSRLGAQPASARASATAPAGCGR